MEVKDPHQSKAGVTGKEVEDGDAILCFIVWPLVPGAGPAFGTGSTEDKNVHTSDYCYRCRW
jgi:hypothetical protein